MTSKTGAQQVNRDGWRKRALGYVVKRQGMTKLGLLIGGTAAIPFVIASFPAIGRGAGRETAMWLGLAFLMLATGVTMGLWTSQRDFPTSH